VKPLVNGELFEVTPDGGKIGHPNWLGFVDEDVNTKFIQAVAQQVWDNEKVLIND
jgi:hypothetical protein